jgi:hypothetical protein
MSLLDKQLGLFGDAAGSPLPNSETLDGQGSLDVEPFDATFRDARRAPLHSWFPYLEGYSPRFVDRVWKTFLPDARTIFEPFAGSGTTPIVIASEGADCLYTEANPVMAYVTRAKLNVLCCSTQSRKRLAAELRRIADDLVPSLRAVAPDQGLVEAYGATFRKSSYFHEDTFDDVLRMRALQDSLAGGSSLVEDCFGVAAVSSLLPVSLLKRAGDVRYMRPGELKKGLPTVTDILRQRFRQMAAEIDILHSIRGNAEFAGEDARMLVLPDGSGFDGVITSPPYLNGTNYIRNARLELWYLRYVTEQAGLRRLRNGVVTSGINDVTARTSKTTVSSGVERVVRKLELEAYDARIAQMACGYFYDMSRAFAAMRDHLGAGGRMCVDIGDSMYAGVHVPTDDLLVEVACELGFELVDRVDLRKRHSNNGHPLRQQLVVLSAPRVRASSAGTDNDAGDGCLTPGGAGPDAISNAGSVWSSSWVEFKNQLPHQSPPYSKRNWGHAYHSLCSYQGKLKPAIAHALVETFSVPGDVVVDPFSGAGTIPFEACRTGRVGVGLDISPLGYVLSAAKVSRVDDGQLESLLADLHRLLDSGEPSCAELESAAAVAFNGAIPEYYDEATLREVLLARRFFLERWGTGPAWALACACTLHILHGNRPYALSRRSHPVTPFKPTGEFEYRPLLPRLRAKLGRARATPFDDDFADGQAFEVDCTDTWPSSIPTADAVITSPPFFDSTRFYMANWIRTWFAGWERDDFNARSETFLETRQKNSLDVYNKFFAAVRERVRESGVVVLHVGQSRKCDMAAELSIRAAEWFAVEDVFTESVGHCESHGVTDKGTVSGHSYMVLVPK